VKRDNFQLDALEVETMSCCSSFNAFEWNFGGGGLEQLTPDSSSLILICDRKRSMRTMYTKIGLNSVE
jgi:hypothetical protein